MSDESTPTPAPQDHGSDETPTEPRRGTRGRLKLGALAATAVLAVTGLTAGGLAIKENSGGVTAANGTVAPGSATSTSRRDGPGQGLTAPEGFGDSGYGGQYGQPSLPTAPGGSGSGSESGQATQLDPSTTSDSTAAASVGLVEISTTLSDGEAAGTGMILTSTGEVVTNHHVVAGATSIKVTVVSTGKTYTARYVGSDATLDVAVLQLQDASGLTPVTTSTTALATGQSITAVGDAGGDGGSLTSATGTVAAQDQSITVQDEDGTDHRLTGLVEIDADIVPGDSGGAVLDAAGDVVGMNVAASSGTAEVTGYAIPWSTVESVVDQVEAGDTSQGVLLGYDGYLGIGLAQSGTSTQVAEVASGEAAQDAGIVVGDTITAIDGASVTTAEAVSDAIRAHDPGERISVSWTTSAGAQRSATVTLGEAPVA